MTDNRSAGWTGHDPDVLVSLANERNGLARQRTAFSWVASGATVARYFASGGLLQARTSIGLMLVAVGALIWLDGNRHYHHQAHNIRADEPTRIPASRIQSRSWLSSRATSCWPSAAGAAGSVVA